jgi:hypothetical protein
VKFHFLLGEELVLELRDFTSHHVYPRSGASVESLVEAVEYAVAIPLDGAAVHARQGTHRGVRNGSKPGAPSTLRFDVVIILLLLVLQSERSQLRAFP